MTFPPRLPIPHEVLEIARTLEDAGYETWCVGGAVRDNLLGLENKDFDMATAARPEEIGRLFRRSAGCSAAASPSVSSMAQSRCSTGTSSHTRLPPSART
jgi:hypothetical protein